MWLHISYHITSCACILYKVTVPGQVCPCQQHHIHQHYHCWRTACWHSANYTSENILIMPSHGASLSELPLSKTILLSQCNLHKVHPYFTSPPCLVNTTMTSTICSELWKFSDQKKTYCRLVIRNGVPNIPTTWNIVTLWVLCHH